MSSLVQQPPRASDLPAWKLQEAKARFSALVREARAIGPQRVTLHGKDVVVVLAVEEFARLAGPAHRPGLHELLSQSPFADLDFEPEGVRAPVREVIL
jgi:prevent-host-death family protein